MTKFTEEYLKDRAYYAKVPSHVLLLPDGSRRYARQHGQTDEEVYDSGQKLCQGFLEVALGEFDIDVASIFFLRPSSFDLQRRTDENLEKILRAINKLAVNIETGQTNLDLNEIYVDTISLAGRSWMEKPLRVSKSPYLSEAWNELQGTLSRLKKQSSDGKKRANFLINYSGRVELDHIIAGNKPQLPEEIGVAIRVGDAMRWSDAPTYALRETHMHLIKKYLPEATTNDFREALSLYIK